MSYKPLKSKDLLKILVIILINILMPLFLLLIVPNIEALIFTSTLIVVPSLILLVGYFLMKREENYLIFSKAFKFCNIYILFISIILCSMALYNIGIESLSLIFSIIFSMSMYTFLLKFFLKNIFDRHKEWVVKNGILSYKIK